MTLRLNGSTSGYTEIDAPAVAGSNTLVLPTGNGSSGQFLQTNGSGALSWAGGGKILQVLSTTKTDSFSATGIAFSDITGLSVTITPSSASSKILITCSINGQGKVSLGFCALKLVRGSTDIAIADAFSSAARATSSVGYTGDSGGSLHSTINYLDSPATTSAITYKVQGSSLHSGVEFYINRNQDDNGVYTRCRTVSTITVMEVAA
jgi:hypothetical protein